jgi:drug/metabolite transporter (DMT)-like permease
MAQGQRSLRPALLALILLSAVWGYGWTTQKIALQYSGPFDFAALRTLWGAAGLFVVLLWKRKRQPRTPDRVTDQLRSVDVTPDHSHPRPLWPKAIRGTLALGLLQTTAFIAFSTWALESGGAGKTAVLVYTMPFWVLLFAWPILGERIRGVQWIAVSLALAGLLLILEPWSLQSGTKPKLLAVLAGFAWALSAIVAKLLRAKVELDLLSLTTWQMLLGSVPLAAIAFFVQQAPINWTPIFIAALAFNAIVCNALAFNAIVCNALAWLLWLYILDTLPASTASMGTLAVPVISVLAAWLQLGERPSGMEALGMVLIGVALAVISMLGVRLKSPR